MEGHLTKKGEEEREFKELAVYELLDDLGISYTRLDHEAVYTIEGCDEIGGLLGVKLCKNLFLCNSQRTKFYLLMMPGDKRFVTAELCTARVHGAVFEHYTGKRKRHGTDERHGKQGAAGD